MRLGLAIAASLSPSLTSVRERERGRGGRKRERERGGGRGRSILTASPDRKACVRKEVLCETRAGNSCFLVTVTNFGE